MTVKSKIIRKIILRAVIMLLVAAALIAIHVAYYSTLKNARFGIFAIPFFALVYAIIMYKSKLLQMLFDKDWEGKVIKSDLILDWEPITFAVAVSRFPMKQIFYTVITVEKSRGEIVKIRIPAEKISYQVFRPNDIIKHYKGTKYPQNMSRSDEIFICPVCGRTLSESDCPDCKVNFYVAPRHYDPYYDWWTSKERRQ
ncbi:MAG: hypothetical protein IJ345_03990 [Clostridia bacterium]|nr:hypothetical protein [Clostridia bacterium]